MKSDLYIFCMRLNFKNLSAACARRLLKSQRHKKDSSQKKGVGATRNQIVVFVRDPRCGLVMGEDADRRNWRDPRCPPDVTTATNVLAHAHTRSVI